VAVTSQAAAWTHTPSGRAPAAIRLGRGPRGRDRGLAAPAADVEHALARRDRGGVEQAPDQALVPGQMPLAVGDPVAPADAVPPFGLRRVGTAAHVGHAAG